MFMFKKLVAAFFAPLSFSLGLLLLGTFLLWGTRRQRAGKLAVTVGTGLLVFFSYAFGAGLLLNPLEYRYPSLQHPPKEVSLKWVVVLGGGAVTDPGIPLTSRLSQASLARLVEGVRLHREVPGSFLLLSGGTVFDRTSEAEVMAQVARSLGVDPERLVLESASRDTEDQARNIETRLGKQKFILVDSASHLPRSMALFHKQGLNPIPAPVGHRIKTRRPFDLANFFPLAYRLEGSEVAVHEYLGFAWACLRGAV
jgi:uncharacterized SAM-binding protein YcdF (DUF218 family)